MTYTKDGVEYVNTYKVSNDNSMHDQWHEHYYSGN